MARWLFRAAVVLCALGIAAAVVVGVAPEETPVRRVSTPGGDALPEDATTDSTTTTRPATTSTTQPPRFPPIAPTEEVRAVRTPTGVLAPVMAVRPDGWEVLTPCSAAAVVPGEPVGPVHVVLDAGHGGSEPGAVGPGGLVEKDVNLDVVLRTAHLLRERGATVALTRETDLRLTLEARGAIARALRPLAFVSVHHNASPVASGPAPGAELYHQMASEEGRRLAGLLWEELQEELAPFGTDWAVGEAPGARARQSVRTGDDFYGVLRRSQGVPAVLSEAVFLSDPEEEALLGTEEFRQAEAEAIADAIERLVATDDPGSGHVATKVSDTPAGPGGGSAGCEDPPLR